MEVLENNFNSVRRLLIKLRLDKFDFKDCQIEQMPKGYGGNEVYLITTIKSQKLILKTANLSGKNYQKNLARKKREFQFWKKTQQKTVYAFEILNKNVFLLQDYIDGQVLASWQINNKNRKFVAQKLTETMILDLSNYLANLHSITSNFYHNFSIYSLEDLTPTQITNYQYDLDIQDCWNENDDLDKIPENQNTKNFISQKYCKLKNRIIEMVKIANSQNIFQKEFFSLIHWDIKPQNIIWNRSKINVIDPEFAHFNLSELDLARVITQCCLDKEQEKFLVQNYYSQRLVNFQILEILIISQKFTKLRDHWLWDKEKNWNLVSFENELDQIETRLNKFLQN